MRYFFLATVLFLSSCSPTPPELFHSRVLSFGTYVEVTLAGVSEAEAQTAIHAIEQRLNIMHKDWHAWRPSVLTEFNSQLQSLAPFQPNPGLIPLVKQSKQLYEQSHGYFNPAIGKLIELWGFYQDNPGNMRTLPAPEVIQALVTSAPSMDDIVIIESSMQGMNKDLQLDFGGYAKGFGVDQLIQELENHQIHNALINAGGDIKAIGQAQDRPWKIAITDPSNGQPMASLQLASGESIFSSGDYQRFFEIDGQRYHHIIDPKTGYPATQAHGVTVVTEDAAVADAAATALMIAPESEWLAIARSMHLKHLFIVHKDGALYCDAGFAKRLAMYSKTPLTILGEL